MAVDGKYKHLMEKTKNRTSDTKICPFGTGKAAFDLTLEKLESICTKRLHLNSVRVT